MDNIFLDRTYSSFPISIGTGLALESLFESTFDRYDKDREIPNKLNIDNYKTHVYSVYTLARNIISATNVKDRTSVILNKTFIEAVVDEINTLHSLYINTKCIPIIYFPNYDKFTTYINQGKENGSTKFYEELIMIQSALKKLPSLSSLKVITDTKLPMSNDKTLITTSMAVDLLNIKNIKQLSLLESHTGKLKERIQWNTKYHSIGTKPMELFPFMEELLFILGDNTVTRPMKLSLRVELFNVAYENNWTGKTTREKVLFDLTKSPELKTIVSSYKKLF